MSETIKINAAKLLTSLEFCELSSDLAPDCRQVIRDERVSLSAALNSGNGAKIQSAAKEAIRIAKMWGVNVAY